MDLKDLKDKRGRLFTEAQAIVDKAAAEKRDMTAEEGVTFDRIHDERATLLTQIQRLERQAEAERELAGQLAKKEEKRIDAPKAKYGMAFRAFLRGGIGNLSPEEQRALEATSDPSGGYLVAPQEFVTDLIQKVDDQTFIRGLATKFMVEQAQSLGVPSLETQPDDADWTAELAIGGEDASLAFGKRELYPRPLGKLIKVSKKLIRVSVMPVEEIVMDRLAYKFGISQEKAFLLGSGASQPLGLFTASANGIDTSRDVSAGNTTTAPTFDGLIAAKYSLKGQYWPRAAWLFNRTVLKVIAQLKDGEGRYIWQMNNMQAGQPDRLLDRPLYMSEYAPNTMTTGLYVGMFGDFSKYYIADALGMTVQRLVELYATTNQDGFIGRLECDGMPVLAEAFARVKLA